MTAPVTPEKPATAQPAAPRAGDETTPSAYVSGVADGNLKTPMRLRDYLTGVGVVFRLSKRDRAAERRALAQEVAEHEAKRIKIPVRKILMVLAPLAAAAVLWTLYERFGGSPLPTPIAGTWSTQDGKYKGRNFWINEKSVAFQNGNTVNEFSIHPIKKVTSRSAADTLFVSVDYDTEGQRATLSLTYRESPQPEIRLANQPAIRWSRAGDAPTMAQ